MVEAREEEQRERRPPGCRRRARRSPRRPRPSPPQLAERASRSCDSSARSAYAACSKRAKAADMYATMTAWSSSRASSARPRSSSVERRCSTRSSSANVDGTSATAMPGLSELSVCARAANPQLVPCPSSCVSMTRSRSCPVQLTETKPGTRVLGQTQKAMLGFPRLGYATIRLQDKKPSASVPTRASRLNMSTSRRASSRRQPFFRACQVDGAGPSSAAFRRNHRCAIRRAPRTASSARPRRRRSRSRVACSAGSGHAGVDGSRQRSESRSEAREAGKARSSSPARAAARRGGMGTPGRRTRERPLAEPVRRAEQPCARRVCHAVPRSRRGRTARAPRPARARTAGTAGRREGSDGPEPLPRPRPAIGCGRREAPSTRARNGGSRPRGEASRCRPTPGCRERPDSRSRSW